MRRFGYLNKMYNWRDGKMVNEDGSMIVNGSMVSSGTKDKFWNQFGSWPVRLRSDLFELTHLESHQSEVIFVAVRKKVII